MIVKMVKTQVMMMKAEDLKNIIKEKIKIIN